MRWRRWSQLSQVQRVDVYTRQSLYLLLWCWVLAVLVTAGARSQHGWDARAVAVAVGGVAVTVLGTVVLRTVLTRYPDVPPFSRWPVGSFLLACAAYLVAFVPGAPDAPRGVVIMIVFANVAWALGGVRDRRVAGGLLITSGLLFGLSIGDPVAALSGAAAGGLVIFTARASLWMLGVVTELDTARRAQAQLAVAEERLRFSRDVHDVLGRRLSTIAVQSELAARLSERGDERASTRMLEVRAVAHEALREARELARGYRPTDLTHELDGARSLLRSAGIDVHLDVDGVPRGWHEAAAWVVREAVTNVLRHSDAGTVRIAYVDGELRVTNDGVRAGEPAPGTGSGLQGLRERLEPLGAGLRVEARDDVFAVSLLLPAGSGPLTSSAATGTRW